jgi:hypothetical protein
MIDIRAMKQLISKVETDYPGFYEKTKDRPVYDNLKENLLNKAGITHDTACIGLLREYKNFFKDGHLTITRVEMEDDANQVKRKSNKVAISPEEFQKLILATADPMEGVWRSGNYKVGIVRQGNVYHGFIIEADTAWWKPGEIKFTLSGNGKACYYMRDHSLSEETYELVDGWILYFNYSKFIKELPRPKMPESEIQLKLAELDGCYFRMVTEKTALLGLSSFEQSYVDQIKSLLAENRIAIESCENLVIDVRNNPGGVYDAYVDLFPYLLTNSVRGIGMEFKVTQTLIDGIQDWYDDEDGKKKAREWIVMFEGKMGEFVNTDTTDVSITEIKPAEKSPKQVVILANRRTASSGEAFLLDARQSKKVKILGTPTYGALDYGTSSIFNFGCRNYKLMMPTWRSMRLPGYPIDNIGIQPDIYLDKSVKDWILFAVDYLENK